MTVMSSSTSSSIARSGTNVFEIGKYNIVLQIVEAAGRSACSSKTKSSSSIPPPKNPPPPKPLLIGMPCEVTGEFSVLLLLHGYLLSNSFYSQLINHIASHGFVVIAPQKSGGMLVTRGADGLMVRRKIKELHF